jgi:hypothetical protein
MERNEFIRKEAITALELIKGFTPEQRANFSNELKTVEEFSGYILELTASKQAQQAVWVKVTSRLPGWGQAVKWRLNGGPETNRKIALSDMNENVVKGFEKWEWLDESNTSNYSALKQYAEQCARQDANSLRAYNELSKEHKALKEKAAKMEAAVQSIANAPAPSNKEEMILWIQTANRICIEALEWEKEEGNG